MKNKLAMLFFVVLFLSTANAEIGLEFNRKGEFVPPDLILQNRAVKSYREGDINKALTQFKRSAKFGNEYSKYLVANLYFEKKNWTAGYAWLQLMEEPIDKSELLKKKMEDSFSEQQLQMTAKKLNNLKEEYNDESSLKRREKWERSLRSVGTNLRGIDAMMRKNVRLGVSGSEVAVEATVIRRAVKDYIVNGYQETAAVQ